MLADASDGDRTIAVAVDVHGSAHWTLSVEVAALAREAVGYASAVARTPPERRALRRSTAFVWSCETRDSVTPSTSPISRSVSSS